MICLDRTQRERKKSVLFHRCTVSPVTSIDDASGNYCFMTLSAKRWEEAIFKLKFVQVQGVSQFLTILTPLFSLDLVD